MEALLGKTLADLTVVAKELGLQGFVAKQMADWLYKKKVTDIAQMSNLSLKARNLLSDKYIVGAKSPVNVQISTDGTKKYLYPVADNKFIESAYIPDKERATLCVSSQVGCKMGCKFCMTAKMGFIANLSANEIINQVFSLPESESLTNLVYMGMGEPCDNIDEVLKSLEIFTADWGYGWSPKRITVSSIGVIPGLLRFLDESQCHLAISLHSPFDEERLSLMPMQKAFPMKEVIENLKKYDWSHQRRVSFEYIMFEGINDSDKHLKELSVLLKDIECRVNLIRFHKTPESEFGGSDEKTMVHFRDELTRKGITTTIRQSRGEDILAACGLLSVDHEKKLAKDC
jgi:23S rRNA (adenine2503-C2)-methyltransferase